MATENDEDRVSTAIKIPECVLKRDNNLNCKINCKVFVIVKGLQYSFKKEWNIDIPASESTYL